MLPLSIGVLLFPTSRGYWMSEYSHIKLLICFYLRPWTASLFAIVRKTRDLSPVVWPHEWLKPEKFCYLAGTFTTWLLLDPGCHKHSPCQHHTSITPPTSHLPSFHFEILNLLELLPARGYSILKGINYAHKFVAGCAIVVLIAAPSCSVIKYRITHTRRGKPKYQGRGTRDEGRRTWDAGLGLRWLSIFSARWDT